MKFITSTGKGLKRQLTVILVPHTGKHTFHIRFTVSFFLVILLSWTLLTLTAVYIAGRHIDYWRVRIDNQLLKLKYTYFAEQIKKIQEMLAEVKKNDEKVRSLLEMKTKKAIITHSKGGPTMLERAYLEKVLLNETQQLSYGEISSHLLNLQKQLHLQRDSHREIFKYVNSLKTLYRTTPCYRPCEGVVNSPFGMRLHPITNKYELHTGIDIANSKGTYIKATADGIVKFAGWQEGYGRLVVIDHPSGYRTYYGHLWKILTTKGQRVKRGEIIGLMGESGTATGVHLHYEISYKTRLCNPSKFLSDEHFFGRR